MSKFASVILFCMIGSTINAPSWYWVAVASYLILCIGDDRHNKFCH